MSDRRDLPPWLRTLLITVVVPLVVAAASATGASWVSSQLWRSEVAVILQWLRRDVDLAHERIDRYHLARRRESGEGG